MSFTENLSGAALACVTDCKIGTPDCQLYQLIPDNTAPTDATIAAVETITGKPVDLTGPGHIPARMRSQLRRWAIQQTFQ